MVGGLPCVACCSNTICGCEGILCVWVEACLMLMAHCSRPRDTQCSMVQRWCWHATPCGACMLCRLCKKQCCHNMSDELHSSVSCTTNRYGEWHCVSRSSIDQAVGHVFIHWRTMHEWRTTYCAIKVCLCCVCCTRCWSTPAVFVAKASLF